MSDDYVLVIDDDPDIRETIVTILEMYGYRGETAGDGVEALAFLRSHQTPPRLVLLDLMMPNVNGMEFRREQLADPSLANIPVVVMTGAPAVSLDPVLSGLDVLVKPLELRTILSHVERYVVPQHVSA